MDIGIEGWSGESRQAKEWRKERTGFGKSEGCIRAGLTTQAERGRRPGEQKTHVASKIDHGDGLTSQGVGIYFQNM